MTDSILSRRAATGALVALVLATAGCDDDPAGPVLPLVSANVAALDFGALDVDFGRGLPLTVTLTNSGTAAVTVGPAAVDGPDFALAGEVAAVSVPAGGSVDVLVAFDPEAPGRRSATLTIPTADPGAGPLAVALSGEGESVVFRQVDRVGIPALNTVFNHPPAFSKSDYNVVSPAADLATYRGRFEVVAGAVANADPVATAALLLPDELPVSLGADATSFAALTGRDLPDDAVDVALTVVVGLDFLHSDNVDANDRAFLGSFPYLAEPHR